jgi:5-methylthioadenosine/S-adenosylhomocysteine deaminase
MPLILRGRVIPLVPSDPDRTFAGRVFLNDDGTIEAVTSTQGAAPAGFGTAPEVDVGDALVLPGLIDLHNHLGYNALPLWAEPAQKKPFRHHNDWTDAPTYRASIGWPAWVLAKAEPEAMLAYVQTRALVGGTTAAQGWPAYNRPPQMVVRNIDTEDAGTGDRNLIYTSALTQQPLRLAKTAQKMSHGVGFIYHCSEGQQGSVVGQEFADAAHAGCLRKTFIGIHCNALADGDWTRWPKGDAGAVVWSPFSNLWLYGTTTNIPEARKRGLLICLGSDWGPSGTKHVLAEMKVAKLASEALHYGLSDRDLVQMVTSNAGAVLSRCWPRQIGTLTAGAFGDVAVLRSSATGTVWPQIVNATERDVLLVVVGGKARYGVSRLMTAAGAGSGATFTVASIKRKLAIPDPADPTRSWRWTDIVARLNAVRKDPKGALKHADGLRRAYAGPMDVDEAPLELALDMPSGGAMAIAGPPPDPAKVVISPLPTLVHDNAFFKAIHRRGFHGGLLDGLANFYE